MRWFTDIFVLIGDVRRELPRTIDIWGGLLNIPQVIGGLVFIIMPEGAAIFVAWFCAMAVGGQIHRQQRFSRLIGVCHAVWLPLIPFLFLRALDGSDGSVYGQAFVIWLWYVLVTMTVSIVFDALDFWRYVSSDDKILDTKSG